MSKTKVALIASTFITLILAIVGIAEIFLAGKIVVALLLVLPLSFVITFLYFAIGEYGEKWGFISGSFRR